MYRVVGWGALINRALTAKVDWLKYDILRATELSFQLVYSN